MTDVRAAPRPLRRQPRVSLAIVLTPALVLAAAAVVACCLPVHRILRQMPLVAVLRGE